MDNQKKAVAIKYVKDIDMPVIMANGAGATAEKIVLEAESSGVYIEENKELVDLIGLHDVGDIVPENAWYALANIFKFILNRKEE